MPFGRSKHYNYWRYSNLLFLLFTIAAILGAGLNNFFCICFCSAFIAFICSLSLMSLSPPQRFPFSCEFLESSVFSVPLYQEPLTIVFVGGSEIEKKIEGNLCQLSVVIWLKLTFSDYSPQTQSSAVPDTKIRKNRKAQGIHGGKHPR